MKAYIFKRSLLLIFLLVTVSSLVFFLVRWVPGDPAVSVLGPGASKEDIEHLHRELNLDKPLHYQYLDYTKNLANLSLGRSLSNNRKVMDNILGVLPHTLYLALASMFLALIISFPLGTLAAFKENTIVEASITLLSAAAAAIPNFFLGPLLIILFSIKLGWLPVSGAESLKHIILPVLTLGASMSALLTRIIKSAVGTELKKPYVLLARAKGLTEGHIFRKHLLKNALIPIVTTIGLQFGALLTGTIITETIFSWPGIGSLLINSIKQRDYPMIQGIMVFITAVYLVLNFLVDLSYFFIDPRIKHELKYR